MRVVVEHVWRTEPGDVARMPSYQARAINELAGRIAVTADILLGASVVMGLLVGWAVGSSAGSGTYALPGALIGAVVVGAAGYVCGLVLRALAQLMLCQVQIETNVRSLAEAESGTSGGSDPGRGKRASDDV
jgi:hypothetical protein